MRHDPFAQPEDDQPVSATKSVAMRCFEAGVERKAKPGRSPKLPDRAPYRPVPASTPPSAKVAVRKDLPDAALFKDMRAAANLPAGVTVDHFRVWCDRTTANGRAQAPWRQRWQEFVAERATWEKLFLATKPPTPRIENRISLIGNSGGWRSRLTKIKP